MSETSSDWICFADELPPQEETILVAERLQNDAAVYAVMIFLPYKQRWECAQCGEPVVGTWTHWKRLEIPK